MKEKPCHFCSCNGEKHFEFSAVGCYVRMTQLTSLFKWNVQNRLRPGCGILYFELTRYFLQTMIDGLLYTSRQEEANLFVSAFLLVVFNQ